MFGLVSRGKYESLQRTFDDVWRRYTNLQMENMRLRLHARFPDEESRKRTDDMVDRLIREPDDDRPR